MLPSKPVSNYGQRPEQGARALDPSKGPASETSTGNARAARE